MKTSQLTQADRCFDKNEEKQQDHWLELLGEQNQDQHVDNFLLKRNVWKQKRPLNSR